MARFYLVRHGQASFGAANYDLLSDLGHQQSFWLGEYFQERNISFDAVVTGDLVRHQETADGILQGMGAQAERDIQPGLNELDFNRIATLLAQQRDIDMPAADASRSEFYRILKQGLYAWQDGTLEMQGNESWVQFSQRVDAAFSHIKKQYNQQKNVLIVSSGGVIGTFIHQILNTKPSSMIELNMQAYNTGITQGFFNRNVYRLGMFNHVSHLDITERQTAMTYS